VDSDCLMKLLEELSLSWVLGDTSQCCLERLSILLNLDRECTLLALKRFVLSVVLHEDLLVLFKYSFFGLCF